MLLILSFGLLIAVLFIVYRWISEYLEKRKILKSIPGPYNLPFVGITWQFTKIPLKDRFKWFNNLCFKFKKGIVLVWLCSEPIITIRKPQHMQVILSSNKLLTKTSRYESIKPWLGDGLLTAKGEIWFRHRRLITPTFHFGPLEEYAATMFEKVEILVDCIYEKLKVNPNKSINVFEQSIKYTLDVICKTAMGIDIDYQRKPDITYTEALHNFARLEGERFVRPWLKWDAIYYLTSSGKKFSNSVKVMHEFTAKVIERRLIDKNKNKTDKSNSTHELDEFGKRKRKAFLDLLLDESENSQCPLTLKEIREEVDTFMFAGHDTTATAISWALFAVANAPEVQKKVHEELKNIFGTSNETATMKQLGQLKYLDRVIKESLRLFSTAPAISRRLDENIKLDDFFIPKGTYVILHIYQLHNDPDIWKNPDIFDPDRFLPENSHGRHHYAFIPFSAGPRNCIGQKFALLEIKIALTAVLRRWRISSILKPSEIKMINNFVLRPGNDTIELNFSPINS